MSWLYNSNDSNPDALFDSDPDNDNAVSETDLSNDMPLLPKTSMLQRRKCLIIYRLS
jgi:hypothetical protein